MAETSYPKLTPDEVDAAIASDDPQASLIAALSLYFHQKNYLRLVKAIDRYRLDALDPVALHILGILCRARFRERHPKSHSVKAEAFEKEITALRSKNCSPELLANAKVVKEALFADIGDVQT